MSTPGEGEQWSKPSIPPKVIPLTEYFTTNEGVLDGDI